MRVAAFVAGALAVLGSALTPPVRATATTPQPVAGTMNGPYAYTNSSGTRQYWIYVPRRGLSAGMPMLVELHGCAPDDATTEARWSRFNTLADSFGFLVVYPQQDTAANGSDCWNWFEPANWTRTPGTPLSPVACNCSSTGEPSLIAGITVSVRNRLRADPRRVYVGGISAGGAMSDIMAVTFPDVYAAALVYAGCDYEATVSCLGSTSATPGFLSGELAYNEMSANRVARVVPVMVVQGLLDPAVPPPNSTLVVQQFLTTDALVGGGAVSPVPVLPTTSTGVTPAPPLSPYVVEEYADAAGCQEAERWLVAVMGHQWSDNSADPSSPTYASDVGFENPDGPDITTAALRFFLAHPMPPAGVSGCYQASSPSLSGGSRGPSSSPSPAVAPPVAASPALADTAAAQPATTPAATAAGLAVLLAARLPCRRRRAIRPRRR